MHYTLHTFDIDHFYIFNWKLELLKLEISRCANNVTRSITATEWTQMIFLCFLVVVVFFFYRYLNLAKFRGYCSSKIENSLVDTTLKLNSDYEQNVLGQIFCTFVRIKGT